MRLYRLERYGKWKVALTKMPGRYVPIGEDKLSAAAREVIAAADNAYGPRWREWDRPNGPAAGARGLARALKGLEAASQEDDR